MGDSAHRQSGRFQRFIFYKYLSGQLVQFVSTQGMTAEDNRA
jgi:hypothetical protein